MFAIFAGSASAQPPGVAAQPDTTKSERFLDRINFHPLYISEYRVNRTSKLWDQSLAVKRRAGAFDLDNRWNLSIRDDPAQSNLRQKRGMMKLNLDYRLPAYGSWTLGLRGDFNRNSQLSETRDLVENRSNFGLGTGTSVPEFLLHRLLPPLENFKVTTIADFGYSIDNSSRRYEIQRVTRRDTTRVEGLFQTYAFGLSGKARSVDINSNLVINRRSGDTETMQWNAETDSLLREFGDASENRKTAWDGRLQWAPSTTFRMGTTARWAEEFNEYWDTQANLNQGGQETKEGVDRSAQFDIDWKPSQKNSLVGRILVSDIEADFLTQERDFHKRNVRGNLDGTLQVPQFLGPVGGTELTMSYSDEESRNEDERSLDYRQRTRRMRGSAKRQVSRTIQLLATQEVTTLQYFYVDGSLDRDERRMFSEGTFNYRPTSAFNGIFNFAWNRRESINIPEERAGNTNTTEAYRVSGDFTYTRGPLSINQRYTIEATYTFFEFSEDENNLARANGVNTTVRHKLGRNIDLTMKHQYQYRDSGEYIRAFPTAPRTYAPASEEIRHVLELAAQYRIGRALRLMGNQKFDQRQRESLASGRVNTTQRAEFSIRANFEQKLDEDFKLVFNFQKVESNSEKNYWNGSAKVERRF